MKYYVGNMFAIDYFSNVFFKSELVVYFQSYLREPKLCFRIESDCFLHLIMINEKLCHNFIVIKTSSLIYL